jgi:hypothetical protein
MALLSSILRQLFSTKFVFILTIGKKSVQRGFGTFTASKVDFNVLADKYIYEE